jgi:hypothetical protein
MRKKRLNYFIREFWKLQDSLGLKEWRVEFGVKELKNRSYGIKMYHNALWAKVVVDPGELRSKKNLRRLARYPVYYLLVAQLGDLAISKGARKRDVAREEIRIVRRLADA